MAFDGSVFIIGGGWPLMGVALFDGMVACDGSGFIIGGGWPLMGVSL